MRNILLKGCCTENGLDGDVTLDGWAEYARDLEYLP